MKSSHWIIASLCFAGFSMIASVLLFSVLPINGAIISIFSNSLLAKRYRFKVKGYLFINFGFLIVFIIVGYIAAMNDLRYTPFFKWMFFEIY